jgi:cell volume regulation protein A
MDGPRKATGLLEHRRSAVRIRCRHQRAGVARCDRDGSGPLAQPNWGDGGCHPYRLHSDFIGAQRHGVHFPLGTAKQTRPPGHREADSDLMSISLPNADLERMILGVVEPQGTAVLLSVLGLLIAFSVLLSRQIDRLGVPVVLLFLLLGMLGGSEGIGGIAFDDYHMSVRFGTIYLVLILFDGGMNTSIAAARRVLAPAGVLATVGVVITALLVAVFGRLLGLDWLEALLLGAVVSSTDAAAVLAVLRGGRLNLRPRVGQTLEVESCINDPMAVILTVTMIQIAKSPDSLQWTLLLGVPVQLAIGAGLGLSLGYLGIWIIRRIRPSTMGLYPALTLALGFVSFGVATLLQGSGFLSVYATALVIGNSVLPYRSGLGRVHEALAWMSQIALFLMLGLLVFPSRLLPVAGIGMGIGLFLAVVARPLAIAICLAPFRYSARETAYIGWIGLRGAVPIILGAFPVIAGVPGAERVFNIVFFIVTLSIFLPGATIRPVTKWLRLAVPEQPRPSAVLEINSPHALSSEIASFFIRPEAAVCGATLSEISLPSDAAVILIVRGKDLVAARGPTLLLPGDHVYVFFRPADRQHIGLLFGDPEQV